MTSSDAPQPPGGPLREDQPDGPMAAADPAEDPAEDQPQEESQDEPARDLQEENAETSLDQPST